METQPLRMLIVDDDDTVLSLLEEIFETEEGFEVTALSDSEKAYERVSRECFHILVTDLMMPKVDGVQLLKHALEVDPKMLVVVITGYASLETTLEAIHAGVYDYITKPFRLEEFRLLIHNAAERIRLVQDNEALRRENGLLKKQIRDLQTEGEQKQKDLEELRLELHRKQELIQQIGKTTGADREPTREKIRFYEQEQDNLPPRE